MDLRVAQLGKCQLIDSDRWVLMRVYTVHTPFANVFKYSQVTYLTRKQIRILLILETIAMIIISRI